MRRVRYVVVMSLDGYIAGPNGEADWIIMDPDIDFHGLFDQFDTFLLGRRTFEGMAGQGVTRSRGYGRSSSRGRCVNRTIRTSPSFPGSPNKRWQTSARSRVRTSGSLAAGCSSAACWKPGWWTPLKSQ